MGSNNRTVLATQVGGAQVGIHCGDRTTAEKELSYKGQTYYFLLKVYGDIIIRRNVQNVYIYLKTLNIPANMFLKYFKEYL